MEGATGSGLKAGLSRRFDCIDRRQKQSHARYYQTQPTLWGRESSSCNQKQEHCYSTHIETKRQRERSIFHSIFTKTRWLLSRFFKFYLCFPPVLSHSLACVCLCVQSWWLQCGLVHEWRWQDWWLLTGLGALMNRDKYKQKHQTTGQSRPYKWWHHRPVPEP